jgi:hypothetical protein
VITCPSCSRMFVDLATMEIHFSYDLKPGVHIVGVHVTEAEREAHRRCGSDGELAGRGLTNHEWLSVDGPRDRFWSNGPS